MITLLLCTVRPDAGYLDHPDWHIIGEVMEDLERQTYRDFELVVVDGLYYVRKDGVAELASRCSFSVTHVPPSSSIWVRNRKVAICGYRNTGIVHARGELIVNLDDCCKLPPIYVECFARAWKEHGICAAMTWPAYGDSRKPGRVTVPGQVYGFGSYPLEAAVMLNGYDEAYDGAQGLEDVDWSTRLFNAGVPMALISIPGFTIERQSTHSDVAIDVEAPLCKCCNAAYQTQRVWRQVRKANVPQLWDREAIERLVGPCRYINPDDTCRHHHGRLPCAYLANGFAKALDPLAAQLLEAPCLLERDISEERREVRVV